MYNSLKTDELTLRSIATGLVAIRQIVEKGKPLSYPYPDPFQRGWNRLVATCLYHRVKPPASLEELFEWCCERPLSQWPFTLSEDRFGAHDKLIDGAFLTELCEELACDNPQVEAELTENQIMEAAKQICRIRDIPNTYAAFRRMMITEVVLMADEMMERRLDPLFTAVLDLLIDAYLEAPPSYIYKNEFHCCPYCGGLLQYIGKGFLCEEERCRANGIVTPARSIPTNKGKVLYLKRGLRRWVTIPGQTEIKLERYLLKLGLAVEMWPGIEAYDLRVLFPNSNEKWALEVKDWRRPAQLARSVRPIPDTPEWTRAFFVFPDERRRQQSDYRRAFDHNCPVLRPPQVRSAFVSELIRLVKEVLNA